MECNEIISAQKYLNRFNNILCNMEQVIELFAENLDKDKDLFY